MPEYRAEPATLGDHVTLFRRVEWLSEIYAPLAAVGFGIGPGAGFIWVPHRFMADPLCQNLGDKAELAHRRLLDKAWQHNANDGQPFVSLPDDSEELRKMAGRIKVRKWEGVYGELFGDGSKPRPWVLHNGRWFCPGLCKSYLQALVKRLSVSMKGGYATKAKDAKGKLSAAAKERAGQLRDHCQGIVDALRANPFEGNLPLPLFMRENGQEQEVQKELPAVDDEKIDAVFLAIVEARQAAFESLGQKVPAMKLTEPRRNVIAELLQDWSLEELQAAFRAVTLSDWHMGTGKYAGKGTRLQFRWFTKRDPVDQLEVLHELATCGKPAGTPPADAPQSGDGMPPAPVWGNGLDIGAALEAESSNG